MPAFKVIHRFKDTETAYLVPNAKSQDDAKQIIRWEIADSERGSFGAVEVEAPIKLYSFNIATGEMS